MAQPVTSPPPRGIRRFLRFSLRSLLLATLAVAVWLGYEVHQARTVERQAAAIRALGGEVEFDFGGWTLLGSVEPERYGRRIAAAAIPVDGAHTAISILASASAVRNIRVLHDGSADLGSFLAHVASQWPEAQVTFSASRIPPLYWPVPPETWEKSKLRQRYARFSAALKQARDPPRRVLAALKMLIDEGPQHDSQFDVYRLVPLSDSSHAELLVISRREYPSDAQMMLLVADKYLDARTIEASGDQPWLGELEIADFDGDGSLDVGFRVVWDRNRPEPWLALYSIEPGGFRNLLPVDRFPAESAPSR